MAGVLGALLISGTCADAVGWHEWNSLTTVGEEGDFMRTMLSRSIIFLVGAGLIAAVYAMRPDVPIGPATSPAPQPTAPARSASTTTTRQIPTDPAPNAFVAMAVKPSAADVYEATIHSKGVKGLDADSPRAELARLPRSVGWGDSYAVRLLGPAGQPMVVAEIVLIVQMADGMVETIAMGALPEAGIYRATVPTRRSVPISLQVGVGSGENRVNIRVRRWQNAHRDRRLGDDLVRGDESSGAGRLTVQPR